MSTNTPTQRPQNTNHHPAPNGAQAAWLVAEREITTRLRSKAFIISTALLLLIVLASVLVSGFVSKSGGIGGPTEVAVVGEVGVPFEDAGMEVTATPDRAAAERLVLDGEVDAAVVADESSPAGAIVLAAESAPSGVVQLLSVQPEVELLDPVTENPAFAMLIGLAFGIVFMWSGITFGTTIAQSVVEEKQTRIVEILLATIPAKALLAGKVIGNSILALATVVAIIAVASVGMLATGQDLLLGELGTSLIWFGILFAFGFVLLATMYAALAALVSRQEDIGSVTSPVMMLIMIPYFLVVFFADNALVLGIMSYVPFSAAVGMPMRVYLGLAGWWEPVVSAGILAISIALMVWVGARIYENSILRTGSRVKLSEAMKGA